MDTLSTINRILCKKILLISRDVSYAYPDTQAIDIDFKDLARYANSNYRGYNIYQISISENKYFICIENDKYINDKITQLVISMIELSLSTFEPVHNIVYKVINEKYTKEDLKQFREKYSDIIKGYIVLIKYPQEYKNEIYEIIINSIDTQLILPYNEFFLVISNEDNIETKFNNISKNILTELFYETSIAISNKINCLENISYNYNNCLEVFKLKDKFKILDNVINYDDMILYKIVADLNPLIKNSIYQKIFNQEFNNIIDTDIEKTIEEFFKNNLNLTDTAESIFIHRNTLLYRLDKISTVSGYDLRKFDDSMIFKIAWLIRKEQSLPVLKK